MALHRLPHNVSMHARPFLPSIIKRLKNALDAELFDLAINFRKTQIKADQKRTFDAVDIKCYKTIDFSI